MNSLLKKVNLAASTIPVLIALLVVLIGLVYFRYSLRLSTVQFVDEFRKQNMVEISRSDIMALTNRLSLLTSSVPWICIEAKSRGLVFYNREKGDCSPGLLKEKVVLLSDPNNDIEIEFVFTFPTDLARTGLLLLSLQLVMLGLVIYSSKLFEKQKFRSQVEISSMAQQVAHDIRSPLSALEMVSSQLSELPEGKRIIIRNSIGRIRDIANSLSRKNVNGGTEGFLINSSEELVSAEDLDASLSEITLLLPVLDLMVTEKRIENRDKLNLTISFDQTQESYGLFARINVHAFKRVLSNIINNAVESLPSGSGKVEVLLREHSSDQIQIILSDTGKGIPKSLIDKIGIRGNTFGKKEGSGLGLAHAKETLNHFGGSLQVSSQEGTGTAIILILPKAHPPDWFVPKLNVKKNSKIVVFDDDLSIHQIWKGRLESAKAVENNVELIRFSNPNELRRYYRENFADLDEVVFLMDYEILDHKETGLDLIEELGIQAQSILVTSRYEESSIRERCERLNVKLIPKSMSGFVPVEIV